jgi:O-antigen/teichoic acid export membrane protein
VKIRTVISYRVFIEIISKILSILSVTIIIRELGISGLGLIIFVSTLSSFFYPLITLGLASGIVRYFPTIRSSNIPRTLLKKILLLIFTINCFMASINFWLIPLIFEAQLDKFNNKFGISAVICIMIMIFTFENIILEYQRGVYQLGRYLLFQTTQICTLFGVALGQTILGLTLLNFLILLLSVRFLILSFFLWFTLKFHDEDIRESSSYVGESHEVTLRSLIKFGVPMSIAGLGNWLMGISDRLIVAKELDMETLGIYGAINNITLMFPAVTAGFFLLAYPSITSAVNSNRENLIKIVRTYHKILSFSLIPLAFLAIVSGRFLLELLISYSTSEMLNVYFLCVVASVIHQWNGLTYYVLAASDRAILIRNIWVLLGLFNFVANFIFISHFGLIGVAIVNLLTFFTLDSILFFYTKKQLGSLVFYDWRSSILALIYSSVSLLLSTLLARSIQIESIRSLVNVLAFLLIYACILWMRHRLEIGQAIESFDLNRK